MPEVEYSDSHFKRPFYPEDSALFVVPEKDIGGLSVDSFWLSFLASKNGEPYRNKTTEELIPLFAKIRRLPNGSFTTITNSIMPTTRFNDKNRVIVGQELEEIYRKFLECEDVSVRQENLEKDLLTHFLSICYSNYKGGIMIAFECLCFFGLYEQLVMLPFVREILEFKLRIDPFESLLAIQKIVLGTCPIPIHRAVLNCIRNATMQAESVIVTLNACQEISPVQALYIPTPAELVSSPQFGVSRQPERRVDQRFQNASQIQWERCVRSVGDWKDLCIKFLDEGNQLDDFFAFAQTHVSSFNYKTLVGFFMLINNIDFLTAQFKEIVPGTNTTPGRKEIKDMILENIANIPKGLLIKDTRIVPTMENTKELFRWLIANIPERSPIFSRNGESVLDEYKHYIADSETPEDIKETAQELTSFIKTTSLEALKRPNAFNFIVWIFDPDLKFDVPLSEIVPELYKLSPKTFTDKFFAPLFDTAITVKMMKQFVNGRANNSSASILRKFVDEMKIVHHNIDSKISSINKENSRKKKRAGELSKKKKENGCLPELEFLELKKLQTEIDGTNNEIAVLTSSLNEFSSILSEIDNIAVVMAPAVFNDIAHGNSIDTHIISFIRRLRTSFNSAFDGRKATVLNHFKPEFIGEIRSVCDRINHSALSIFAEFSGDFYSCFSGLDITKFDSESIRCNLTTNFLQIFYQEIIRHFSETDKNKILSRLHEELKKKYAEHVTNYMELYEMPNPSGDELARLKTLIIEFNTSSIPLINFMKTLDCSEVCEIEEFSNEISRGIIDYAPEGWL